MTYGVSNSRQTESVLKKYPFVRKFVNSVHGSGIDYDWFAEESQNNIRLYNSYHTMDEYGRYDAVVDFAILIPKKNPLKFKLQFLGDRCRYYANKYDLRDYLEDTIYDGLEESLKGRRNPPQRTGTAKKRAGSNKRRGE